MNIGYARVSTTDQDTHLQIDALKVARVSVVFQESGSGVGPRPQLQAAILRCGSGDVLTVWKLDRCARSLSDLLGILSRLKARGAAIKSLTEPVDTSTPVGEFTFQILGAVAQLERSMIRERVIAGQIAARARGKTWGPARRFEPDEMAELAALWRGGWADQPMLAQTFGASVSTVRDAIHAHEKRGRYAVKTLHR